MRRRQRLILSPSVFFLLCVSATVFAQSPQSPASAAAAGSAAKTDDGVAEIVVTAERRSEHLQDVPATVAVASGAALASNNITNSLELGQLVPSVRFTTLGNYTQPVIRGISTQVSGVGNGANVALYIDGVYIQAQDAYNFDFVDVDSIEVLEGPQGTLYGRNATGGAILVTTKKPSFDFGGAASASYASFGDTTEKLYLTGPLNDKIAFNIAGLYQRSDGYLTNITNGNDVGGSKNETVKGKLLFKASDNLEFLLGADHSLYSNPIGYDQSTYNRNSIAYRTPGVAVASQPYQVSLTFDPIDSVSQSGTFLKGTLDLSDMILTSLTAYRHLSSFVLADADYSPLKLARNLRAATEGTFSQDLNLAYTGSGPLSFLAGAQFLSDISANNPFSSNNVPIVSNRVLDTAASAFAELSYKITRELTATAGMRFSYEHKELNGDFLNIPRAPVQNGFAENAWTPHYSLRYSPSEDLSLYATYNKGFKPGGYNTLASNSTDPAGNVTHFNAETVNGYEVGIKTQLTRAVSLDVATYYYNYRDEQVSTASLYNGIAGTEILNAASAQIFGAETEMRFRLSSELTAQAGFDYTHGRSIFPNAYLTQPVPGGGNTTFIGDASGERLERVPDETANVSAEYQHHVGNAGTLYVSGNVFFTSRVYWDFSNRLSEGSYTVANAQIGFSPSYDDRFRIAVFCKNLTDKAYALLINATGFGDTIAYAPPRVFGVSLDVNF